MTKSTAKYIPWMHSYWLTLVSENCIGIIYQILNMIEHHNRVTPQGEKFMRLRGTMVQTV